jgi:hypothetical protein
MTNLCSNEEHIANTKSNAQREITSEIKVATGL